ncbi:MAG TPA: phosphoribosylformylglycinamidine synthase, purS protein [Candidatus Altiarchaeales archaeon]|nr:phosphoribosylformylglycinamidine synthase, purS protein [Candidatus Altiarchaeales archaeon]
MNFEVEVRIELKPGVIDAEGETIRKSLKLLGYPVNDVKSLKVYVIDVNADSKKDAEEKITDACRRLLANPVIQNYSVKVKNARIIPENSRKRL